MNDMITITRGSFRATVKPENVESVQTLLDLPTDKLSAEVGSRKNGSRANPRGEEIRDAIKQGLNYRLPNAVPRSVCNDIDRRDTANRGKRLEIVRELARCPWSEVPYWVQRLAFATVSDGLHHFNDDVTVETIEESDHE